MFDFATLAVRMDNTQFLRKLDQTAQKAQLVSKKIRTAGLMISAMAIPLGLFAKSAVTNLTTFDDAMTKSTAIMSSVSEEMRKELEETAKILSTQLPVSADKAAESYFFLASAGLDAAESLAALPVVARFATAGAFDMATATDLLTDAQSALGLASGTNEQNLMNMKRLSDIFVKGNTLANTSVQQLSEALTNDAGASMRALNIELENGVAVLAAYADQGIKGATAGSMFGRMLRLIGNEAIENKKAFAAAGISVFDASGNYRDFSLITRDLEDNFATMGAEARLAGLKQLGFSALVAKAILPLIGTSDAIARYTKELKDAGGTTADVVNKQLQSLGVQFILIRNKIKVLSIDLASRFEPELRAAQKAISGIIDKFRELSPKTQKIIGAVILFVIALGPLLIALSFIAPALIGGVAAMGTFASSIGPIMVGITILAMLFKVLKGAIKQVAERTEGFRSSMSEVMSEIIDPLSEKLSTMGLHWKDLGLYIQSMGFYLEAFGAIGVETFIYLGSVIDAFLQGTIGNIGVFFGWLSVNWNTIWENNWNVVKAFGSDILGMFKSIGTHLWDFITGDGFDFDGLIAEMGTELEKAFADKKELTDFDFNSIGDDIAGAADIFGTEFNKILEDTQKKIDAIAAVPSTIDPEGLADKVTPDNDIAGNGNNFNDDDTDSGLQGTIQKQELQTALVKGSIEAYKAERTAELANKNIKANEQTAKNTKSMWDILKDLQQPEGVTVLK